MNTMSLIIIIALFIAYAVVLFAYYRPSIDIVVKKGSYDVLLWYNVLIWDNEIDKVEIRRKWRKLVSIKSKSNE